MLQRSQRSTGVLVAAFALACLLFSGALAAEGAGRGLLDSKVSTLVGGNPGDGAADAKTVPLDSLSGGIARDSAGNIYFTEGNRVFKMPAAGGLAVIAGSTGSGFEGDGGPALNALLSAPTYLAVDSGGNIFVVDSGNNRIRKLTTDLKIATVVGSGTGGNTIEDVGLLGVDARINGSGIVGLVVDGTGNIFFADGATAAIYKAATGTGGDGTISIIAGNGLARSSASGAAAQGSPLNGVFGLAMLGADLVCSEKGAIRLINISSAAGVTSTVIAGALDTATPPNVVIANPIFPDDGTQKAVQSISPTVLAGGVANPGQLAVDGTTIYYWEGSVGRIRAFTNGGTIKTVFGEISEATSCIGYRDSATPTTNTPRKGIAIAPGPNGVLDTAAQGDDQVVTDPGTGLQVIEAGPNGIVDTTAQGDDVQVVAVGAACPVDYTPRNDDPKANLGSGALVASGGVVTFVDVGNRLLRQFTNGVAAGDTLKTVAGAFQPYKYMDTAPGAPVISSPLTATATQGAPFSYTITATDSPTLFGVSAGLPAWLTVNVNTGVISGTPPAPVNGVFSLTVTASNPTLGKATLILTVNPPTGAPLIDPAKLSAPAAVGTAFTYTVPAAAGSAAATGYVAQIGGFTTGTVSAAPALAPTTTTFDASNTIAPPLAVNNSIIFTSGAQSGQIRVIKTITPNAGIGTNTITVTPALAAAPAVGDGFSTTLLDSGTVVAPVSGTITGFSVTAPVGASLTQFTTSNALPIGLSITFTGPAASPNLNLVRTINSVVGTGTPPAAPYTVTLNAALTATPAAGDTFSSTTVFATSSSVANMTNILFTAGTGATVGNVGASRIINSVVGTGTPPVAPFIVTLNFALTNLPAAGDGFIAAASGAFYAPTAYQFDATTAVVNAYNANKGTNLLFTNGAQKGQVTGIAGTAGQTIKVSPPLPGAPAAAPAADPFVINNLPAGLGFDPGTGIISGTPLPNSVGTYFISLLAVNATGASNATLTLTIAPKTGTPPAITSALTATVAEGAAAGPIYQIKGSNTPTAFSAIPIAQGPLSSPAGSVLASSSTTGTTANWPQQFNFVAAGTSTTAFTTNSPVAGATSITFTVCSAPTAANLGKTIALSSVVGTGIPPVAPFTVTLGAALTVTPAGGDQFTAAVPPTTTTFATSAVLTGLSQIQFTGGTPIGINTVTPGLPPNLPSQYTVTLLTPLAAAPAAGATFTAFTPPPTATTFSTLTPLAVGQTIVFTSGTQIGKQVGVTVAGSPVTVAPALAAAPASGDSFVVTPLRSGVVQPTNGAVLATYPVTNNTVSGAPAPTTTVFTTFSPVATATSITFTTCSAATAANLNQTYTVTVSAPPAPYTVTITPPATFAIAPAGGDRFTANLPPTKAIFATNTQPVGNVIEFTGVTAANIGQVCTITSTPTQGPTGPIAPYTINITSAALPAAPVLNDTFIFPTLTAPTATSFATSIAGQLAPKMNIMFTSGTDKGQSSTITGIVDQTVIVSPAFSAVPAATDAFTANSLPTNLLPVGVGLGFDPTTGIISGSPAPQSNGVYDILIQASNASGSSLVNTLTLTITPPAPPATVPAITSASTAVAISGTLFQYQATATNTPTSFSAAGLPAGLSIDPVSGLISGTPNVAVATIYKVALSASNASGTGSARLTITVEPVAVPPVLFAGTAAGAGFAQNITDNAPVAAKGALISNPRNLALDGSGNVYFDALDYYLNQKIYKYATNQQLSVVAGPVYVNGVPTRPGEGGPAPFAPLNGLGTQVGVPADSSSVLIADTQPPTGASSNTIVRVTNGALATVAGIPGIAGSVNPNGDRTQLQANGAVSPVISRVGQQANAVLLKTPQGVLATSATGFVVADTGNSKVMQVDDTGKVANDVNLDFAPSFLAQLDTTKNVFIAGSTAVTNSAPIILSPATASGTVGQPFTYQIASAGGATTFSSTSILPGWLAFTLDPTTGLTDMLTGTPTIGSDGTFTIQLTVGNVSGNATAPLTITIAPGTGLPAVTSAQIPAVEGVKVIYQITATNNSTPPVGYNAQVAALGVGGQVSDNPPPTATTFATTPLPMPAVGSTIMFTSGKQSGSIVVVASAARNAAFQQTITVTPALAAAPAAGDSFVPTNVVPGVVAGPLSGAVLAGTSTTSFTTNTWLAVGESVLFTGPAASPNLNLTSTIATVTPTITFGFAGPPFTITLTGTLPLAATPLAADTFTATPPASTTTTFSVPPAVAAALAANRNILFTGGAQKGQVGQILGIAGSTVTLKAALPAGPGAGDTFIVNDLPAGLGFDYTSGLISGTLAFGTYTGAPSFVNLSAANALGAGHGILELDISRAAPGGTVQASAGGAVAAVAAGNLVMAATAGQAVVAGTSTTSFTTNTANLAVGMNIQFASAGANNLLIRTISAVTGPAPFTITLSTPLTITPVAADTFTPWAGAVTAGISSNVFTTAVTGLAVGMNIQFTSGANNLLIRTITAYTGAAAPFTVTLNSALTATPAAADTFLAPVSSTTVFTTAATGLTKGMNIMFTSGADNGSVGTISAITGSAAPFTITLTAALGAAPADNDTFSAPASTTTSFTTAATGLAPGMLIQFTGPVNNLNAVGTIATVTGTAAPFIITLTAPLVTAPAAADTFNAPVANATTFTTATPLENGTKIVFTKSASGNPPTVNTIAAPVPPAVPCTVTIAPGFANPIVAGDAFVTGDVPKFINIPAALPSGMVNVPYSSFTVQFINAPTLFTASTVATLPPGLTLNTSTGVISGTPTKSGTYNFTITAANLFGPGSNNFTSTIVISQGGLRQIDLTGTTPVVTPFGPPLTGLTGMATGTNGLYVSESNKITLINAAGTPVYVAQDTKRLFDASALASTITGLFASGTTVRYATSEGVIREYTDGTPLAAPAALPVVKAGRFFLLTGTGGPAVQVGFNFKSYTPLGMVKTFQLVGDDGALQYREVDYTTNPISATVLAGAGKNNNPAPTGEGVSATAVTIGTVGGIAVDAKGTVYFSDQGLNTIRMVPAVQNATITTYAGVPNSSGYSGNGLPAKSSLLNGPAGLAFSAAGELYFCESSNCVVRKVSNGNVVLVAGIPCQSGYAGDGYGPTMALFEFPSGLCFDPRGDLFITDSSANVIRVLDAKGIMNTVAGISYGLEVSQAAVPALESDLGYPIAITRDVGGKLYTVGGSSSNTIIRTKGGMCQVVAGMDGASGFNGDGLPGVQTLLNLNYFNPITFQSFTSSVLFVSNLGLVFTDTGNNRVRVLTNLADTTNTPPTAVITVTPTGLLNQVPYKVVLDGSLSTDPDGDIVSYDWDLGDGTTASGSVVDYTYGTPKTYTVTLTVTDSAGNTSKATATIIAAVQVLGSKTNGKGAFKVSFVPAKAGKTSKPSDAFSLSMTNVDALKGAKITSAATITIGTFQQTLSVVVAGKGVATTVAKATPAVKLTVDGVKKDAFSLTIGSATLKPAFDIFVGGPNGINTNTVGASTTVVVPVVISLNNGALILGDNYLFVYKSKYNSGATGKFSQ